MPFFDLVLIIIVAGFALFGFWFGLVHTLGSLFGTVLGVYLASRYYVPAAEWLMKTTGWSNNVASIIMFIIAFIVINRLVGFAFFLVDRLFSIVTRLPFISGLNRMLGTIFGAFEGVFVVGIVLFFISKFPVNEAFMGAMNNSRLAAFCISTASILWPLIADTVKNAPNFGINLY